MMMLWKIDRSKFELILKNISIGTYSYFLTAQKFSEQTGYSGPGILMVSLEGLPLMIKLQDDKLISITTRNMNELRKRIPDLDHFLRNELKIARVAGVEYDLLAKGYLSIYRGIYILSSSRGSRIPIYEAGDLTVALLGNEEMDIKFSHRDKSLKLRQRIGESLYITIVKLKGNYKFFDRSSVLDLRKFVSQSYSKQMIGEWITFAAPAPEEITTKLTYLKKICSIDGDADFETTDDGTMNFSPSIYDKVSAKDLVNFSALELWDQLPVYRAYKDFLKQAFLAKVSNLTESIRFSVVGREVLVSGDEAQVTAVDLSAEMRDFFSEDVAMGLFNVTNVTQEMVLNMLSSAKEEIEEKEARNPGKEEEEFEFLIGEDIPVDVDLVSQVVSKYYSASLREAEIPAHLDLKMEAHHPYFSLIIMKMKDMKEDLDDLVNGTFRPNPRTIEGLMLAWLIDAESRPVREQIEEPKIVNQQDSIFNLI
jgi:hypothetical protein